MLTHKERLIYYTSRVAFFFRTALFFRGMKIGWHLQIQSIKTWLYVQCTSIRIGTNGLMETIDQFELER